MLSHYNHSLSLSPSSLLHTISSLGSALLRKFDDYSVICLCHFTHYQILATIGNLAPMENLVYILGLFLLRLYSVRGSFEYELK